MSVVQQLARAPGCQARYHEDAQPGTRTAVKVACFGVAVALTAAIALPMPKLIHASVAVCLLVAALMFAVPRAWSLAAAGPVSSAMAERVSDPYWNSETFTFALVGGLLVVPAALGSGIASTTVVIVLITALLLAAFTPFCVGRLTYAVLFHRDRGDR